MAARLARRKPRACHCDPTTEQRGNSRIEPYQQPSQPPCRQGNEQLTAENPANLMMHG
jgi:hypothetical protein